MTRSQELMNTCELPNYTIYAIFRRFTLFLDDLRDFYTILRDAYAIIY